MFSQLLASFRLLSRCAVYPPPRTLLSSRTLLLSGTLSSSGTVPPPRPRPSPGGMWRAAVRCLPGEAKLTISFVLDGSHKHMLRDQDEELGRVLSRIAHSIAKGQGRAKKSKKNRAQEAAEGAELTTVKLYHNGAEVPEEAPNVEAWQDGAELHIGELRYAVHRNAPTFTAASLPASLMAGFPVCPRVELEFGQLEDCLFTWFKETSSTSSPEAGGDPRAQEEAWAAAGSGRVYVPSAPDIGSRLKLLCVPQDGARAGPPRQLVSTARVEAGPGTCTCDNRHVYTPREAGEGRARVVSYNILADVYAQTELSRTVLYPYCPPYALTLDYRQNLLKKELAGYHAHFLCLQEVDKGVFLDSLGPALDAFGLDGVFRIKEKQHEGLATFYRRSKFRLLSRHDIVLSEALTSDPRHAELLEALSSSPTLKNRVLQRSTPLQVSLFQDLVVASRTLCVANTHLYWHPKGGNVRLVQISVALAHLDHVIRSQAPGAALIFCGDFNSSPNSGVYQLLSTSRVPASHPDWISGGPEESCPLDLHSPLPSMLSACGEPAYTNYVGGFHGVLDYIFLEPSRMEVDQVIPLPSHQEVTCHQALPSVAHPSDHIALVCDLSWRQ